jgi:putative peptidoglycan lipid II flippase
VPSAQSFLKSGLYTITVGICGKALGFLSTLFIAYKFGASQGTDIAFFSFAFVMSFSTMFTDFNANILLPQYSAFLQDDQLGNANKLLNRTLTKFSVFIFILVLLMLVFSKPLLVLFSDFDAKSISNGLIIFNVILPMCLFLFISDLFVNIAQAHKNFFLTNIGSLIHGTVLISTIYFFSDKAAELSIAIGFCGASVFQALLGYFFLSKNKIVIRPDFGSIQGFSCFKGLLIPVFLYPVIIAIFMMAPEFIALRYAEGSLTAINFAKKVFMLGPGLLIFPLVLVLYPRLCNLSSNGNNKAMLQKIFDLNILLVGPVLVFSGGMYFYSHEIISILFARGKFDENAVALAALAVKYFVPAMFVYVIHSITGRALMATQQKKTFMINLLVQIVGLVLYVGLLIYCVHYWKVAGIAYAHTLYYLLYLGVVDYLILHTQISPVSIAEFLAPACRAFVVFTTWMFVHKWSHFNSLWFPMRFVIGCIVVGFVLYFVVFLLGWRERRVLRDYFDHSQ